MRLIKDMYWALLLTVFVYALANILVMGGVQLFPQVFYTTKGMAFTFVMLLASVFMRTR